MLLEINIDFKNSFLFWFYYNNETDFLCFQISFIWIDFNLKENCDFWIEISYSKFLKK